MKRLIEDESLVDGLDRHLAELLRAAEPFRVDQLRRRRILRRLERASVPGRARSWARPGFAAALFASGTAAAALGHRYHEQGVGMIDLSGPERASVANVLRMSPS